MTQRVITAVFFTALAVFYAIAWFSPAIGLYHDDAVYLVTAKAIAAGHGYTIQSLPQAIPQTKYPPLFAAVLALFVLISQQTQWLKLLPLLCALGWFMVLRRLLLKMGASRGGALLIVGLTAASPFVIFLSTNLMSETMFALLTTSALLMILEEKPLAAGTFAALATLTRSAGVALIAACILTLVIRRRFRSAVIFTAVTVVMVAPWFGWSLANAPADAYYGSKNYLAQNILTSLPANEKIIVLVRNAFLLLASPMSLLTGFTSTSLVIGTALLGIWCLYKRRQLMPDLFLGLYCLMLLCWTWPPESFVAPILPLVLWIAWRVLSQVKRPEPIAACILILACAGLWADFRMMPLSAGQSQDNWTEMQKMFNAIKMKTSPNSVLMANLDPVMYLNTGRKAVRGFVPNSFGLLYAATPVAITPDELSTSIQESQVNYVVLTPDRGFAEAPSFHKSVETLENGGILEPVPVQGILPQYRLLHVVHSSF